MIERMKRWRVVPVAMVAAVALWACEPVDPSDDPLPPIEEDFGDTEDGFDDPGDTEDDLEP